MPHSRTLYIKYLIIYKLYENLPDKLIKNVQCTYHMNTGIIGKCMKMPISSKIFTKGEGAYIFDSDNQKYIDMMSGASVAIFGYGNNCFTEAYSKSANSIQHTCFCYAPNDWAIKYAEKIAKTTPGKFSKKVVYGLSGSDAMDGAVKMARAYTKKEGIISFKNSYHGSTGISINVTSWKGISKITKNHHHIHFPKNKEEEKSSLKIIRGIVKNKEVAAIVSEPIQGDAGVIIPTTTFIKSIWEICRQNNMVTIVDEVQTGMGRTGKFWAIEHFGVIPDIIVAAKSITAGYIPMSAIIGREPIVDSIEKGQHVFTYAGHPPSCAIAMEVINQIESGSIIDHVNDVGSYFISKIKEIKSSIIKDVRGKGLMIGIEVDPKIAKIIIARCFEKGIYFGIFGTKNEVIRIEPPLIIDKKIIDKTISIFSKVIKEVETNKIPEHILDQAGKMVSIGN